MPLQHHTRFKGITNIGDDDISNQIETNLVNFIDWALLKIGGWFDVAIPTSGAYGGDFSTLRAVQDEAYTDGQVWETPKKHWVYETGVLYQDTYDPVTITGVEINGTGYATGDATYGHHYNYHLGRVVFDTAIPTSSAVRLNYSYRYIQVYRADSAPWWDIIQYNSFRPDDSHFEQLGSGIWSIGGQHRIQLPAIVVETVPRGRSSPFQLGDGSLELEQDVLIHVLAENRAIRNNLVDYFVRQNDRSIVLYNTNTVAASGDYPLDYRGMLVGTKMYPELVEDHQLHAARFTNVTSTEVQQVHTNLHEGTVRITLNIVLDGL